MSVAKRRRGESSRMPTHLGVGQSSRGRIVHGANRPAFGRNVHGAKRTVGETSVNRKSL